MKSRQGIETKLPVSRTTELFLPITIVSVSLFFWSPALDAFNYPKAALLSLLVISLLILGLPKILNNLDFKAGNLTVYFLVIYLVWQAFVAISHGLMRPEILWGVFSRANGFVTSSSFLILSILLLVYISSQLVSRIAQGALCTLTVLSGYGILQLMGRDPVPWVNPYNQIIGTVGNPNFSSALFVVLSLICFSYIVGQGVQSWLKGYSFLLVIVALFLSYKSQSVQGLISFLAAAQVFVAVKIWLGKRSTKFKVFTLLPLLPMNLVVLAALINKGPLAEYIYQYTLKVRFHYWRVAIEMIRDFPIFGVGQDQYGMYYQKYREVDFVKQYGPSLLTNNAHNVYLQAGATTGILSFVFLSLIAILVIVKFLRNISAFSGQEQTLYLSMFSAWVAYFLQSVISIEQIGIAVWGWGLTGLLLGFPKLKSNVQTKEYLWDKWEFPANSVYILVALTLAYPMTGFVRSDLNLKRALGQEAATDNMVESQTRGEKIADAIRPLISLQDYTNFAVRNLFQAGPADQGVLIAEASLNENPRLYVSNQLLTSAYKQFNQTEKVIQNYQAMQELDPLNYFDMIQFASFLIQVERKSEASILLQRVLKIGNPEAVETASAILKSIE